MSRQNESITETASARGLTNVEGQSFTGEILSFGQFIVSPACRTLVLNGRPIRIGARAYDMLLILLRSPGKVVSKDAIMQHVWPSTTVDECNLRFQMTSLRKALGEERDRIKTIPGRGYLFVADSTLPSCPMVSVLSDVQRLDGMKILNAPTIVIIDRNPETREALQRLLRPFAATIASFASMEALLKIRSTVSPTHH